MKEIFDFDIVSCHIGCISIQIPALIHFLEQLFAGRGKIGSVSESRETCNLLKLNRATI